MARLPTVPCPSLPSLTATREQPARLASYPGLARQAGSPGLDPEYRRQFSKTFTFRELAAGRHMSRSATEVNDDGITLVELQRP